MAIREFVIGIAADQVTLLRDLQVVHRSVVVGVAATRTAHARGVEDRVVDHQARTQREDGAGNGGRTRSVQTGGRQGRRTELLQRKAEAFTAEGEVREGAVALEDRFTVEVFGVDGGATAAIVEAGADRAVHLVTGAVATLGQGVLAAHFEAFDLLETEVHNASQRVRTVHGRGAAGHDVDGLDQELRDGVEVDHLVGVERDPAAAVDQHQGTGRAEAAQVESGSAVTRVVREGGGARNDLRQRVQHVFNVDRTRELEFLGGDNRDRSGGFDVALLNARTGDDDEAFVLSGGVGGFGVLRIGGSSEHGTGHERAREERSLVETSHFSPLDARTPG